MRRDKLTDSTSYWYAWWFSVIWMGTWARLLKIWTFKGQNEKDSCPQRLSGVADDVGSMLAEEVPVLCQRTLLKLGRALHETPFSNRNHEKKMVVQCGFLLKTRWCFVVQPRFDLKPERAHYIWLDLVLRFTFHLVLFIKLEIWGSDEGCKMNKTKVGWNLVRVGSSCYRGSAEINLTSILENAGSVPGLAQWG